MAEENNLHDQNMTKSPVNSDIGEDVCEKDTLDENEEEAEIDPNFVEERFRVDRRKLEQMIQDPGEDETAEDFFLRVMHQTDTTITWPSKLKIGAKSKKDPHIKVSGDREAVGKAKDMVMTVLDTKSTRVTLKMDVSYTEHSHVIGKGGNNIKKVMQDTRCHIHFPDSNRSNQAEKSNQVSIAGQPSGVEQARSKIRELLPLVFMFELPMTGVLQPIPDANSPTLKQIQDNYNVTVSFKQRPQVYMTTVIIRGTVYNAKAVKEGTMRVIEHLTGNIGNTTPVSMQLEIAPQHHLFIIGRAGANIKQIMQQTGATIHFPDPNSTQTPRKGTVYLTGPIESVCLARQHLIGCLPLVLMFDMKEECDMDQAKMTQLMEQLDVFISIKPKPKQPSKSVIVKSIERNASKLYEARRRLLGLSEEGMPPPTSTDNTDPINSSPISFSALGLLGHNLLKINTGTNPLLLLNGTAHRSPLATTLALGNQVTCTLPSNLITSTQPGSQLYAPQNVVLVPRHPLQGAAATVQSMGTRLAQQQAAQHTLKIPAGVVAANMGGLSVPPASQQKPKTLKDINQNVQNHTPPSSSPTHTGSPLRGSTFPSQVSSIDSPPPSTPPPPASIQDHPHLGHNLQKHQPHSHHHHSKAPPHPTQRQGADKQTQESLLQRLKLSQQYDAVYQNHHLQHQAAKQQQQKAQVSQQQHQQQQAIATNTTGSSLSSSSSMASGLERGLAEKPVTRPPPGLPPPSSGLQHQQQSQQQQHVGVTLNHSSSPLDLMHNHHHHQQHQYQQNGKGTKASGMEVTMNSSSSSPNHGSPQPQIDLSSLKSGQDLLDLLLLPKSPPDPSSLLAMSHLSRAERPHPLLNSSAAGDLFSSQAAGLGSNPQQNLQDLGVQSFSHLTSDQPPTSSSSSSSGHCAELLTRSVHLKPGSPQLPAHPPDSPLPPGMQLPNPGNPAIMQLLTEEDIRRLAFQNGRRSSLVSNHSSDSSDGSDPNLGPCNPASSLFSGEAILEAFDYERKKLMATKAMSKKPLGESRIPTDYWSGFGFSKSMPDSTIRDKLRENNVRKYQGPSMPTTYEGDDLSGDEDKDPWKDSPLQSPSNSFNAGMRQRRTPPSPASPQHQAGCEFPTRGSAGASAGVQSKQASDWPPTTDLAELFSQLGLGKYTYLFQEQEIDMATFLTLTDIDLKELGITTFGARRKMLLAIADLNKKQTLSAAPGANNPFRKMGTLEKNSLLSHRGDIVSQSGRW